MPDIATEIDSLLLPSPGLGAPPPPYSRHSTHSSLGVPTESPLSLHTALEYRGTLGNITLETIDGARFLIHQELLESECAFFYIYFKTHRQPAAVAVTPQSGSASASLFCLDRWFPSRATSEDAQPPPLPRKNGPVTAPRPVTPEALEWQVPETKAVLLTFLSFIYPLRAFPTEAQLTDISLLRDVLRSGLGYQSERVISRVKKALVVLAQKMPVATYALATRYDLHDLAVLASKYALQIPEGDLDTGLSALMGSKGYEALRQARLERLAAMQVILRKSSPLALLR